MAERVQLKVDLEANLGKVVEATKSLKLDKGQTKIVLQVAYRINRCFVFGQYQQQQLQ